MNNEKYFNFPIQLLVGFMINDNINTLNNISYYSIYENSLKLEYGTELQKIKDSADYFVINLGNAEIALKTGKMLYNSIPRNSPKVGLNTIIFWDFYKNDKTEFDKICLLAFLSIKSIIGSKPYHKATNTYLWSRMDGKTKTIVEVSELSTEVRKFANRYQTTKIINELVTNWHLIYYSFHLRGFVVSFKLSLDNLVFIVEKNKKSNKEQEQKNLIKEARIKALERLKS